MAGPKREDLSGRIFGRLLVLGPARKDLPDWSWYCRCECGAVVTPSGGNLKRPGRGTSSCGCIHGVAISDPIEHDQLLKLLRYDSATGVFMRLRDGHIVKAGDVAGYSGDNGYVYVGLGAAEYAAHILAWFYMTKLWPSRDIDHKDTDPANNSWNNLRLATESQNIANSRLRKDNTTGYKGVSKKGNRYIVRVGNDWVGTFTTSESAARAYDDAACERYGEFARTNFGARI